MTDVSIRAANVDDAGEVSELVCCVAESFIALTLTSDGVDNLVRTMKVEPTTQRMLEGWPHIAYSSIGKRIVGVCLIKLPAHLYHLFVHADLHAKGVGRFVV